MAATMDVAREKVVVCDNGTGYVKCGFAGDNFPRAVFPCMVGRPTLRYEEALSDTVLKDIVVGQEAADHRSNLEVRARESKRRRGAARPRRGVRPRVRGRISLPTTSASRFLVR